MGHLVEHAGALHDEVHVLGAAHAVDLGVNDVERDACGLVLAELGAGVLLHDSERGLADLELTRVDEGHLVLERVGSAELVVVALDGKLQVICQDKGQATG